MARSSAATARAAAAPAHAPSRRPAPPTRRRSGPVHQPARRAKTADPARQPARRLPGLAPAVVRFAEARTAGLVDRLLRGRVWVGFVGALLAGIVFLNVSLLQLNQDIARTTTEATGLDRQNSVLRARLSAFDSSERIQRLATARGMFMPAPSQYRYLVARPWLDAELARRASFPHDLATASTTGTIQPTSATGTPVASVPASATGTTTTTTTTATTSAATAAAPTAAAGTP